MTEAIAYRGPDEENVLWLEQHGVGLGHRRLSIQDLSAAGSQPMVSASGRFVIAYNGEIYNCDDFKPELLAQGYTFRGTSDTEVMLAAFEHWGVTAALQRFVGMFSFALLDKQAGILQLARDRIGIKPMYYGRVGKVFAFTSELKPLHTLPDNGLQVNPQALAHMLRTSYVPAPLSIYRDVVKLEPGCVATIPLGDATNGSVKVERFWSAAEAAQNGLADRFAASYDDALGELDRLLRLAVKQRLVSDVPLGAFLSGGIDSSTVVALMQAQNSSPVKTFSIGFDDALYDEAGHARAVARHLGTEHTELYIDSQTTLDVVPDLPAFYDEPFADVSQIPTYLVSKLARESVTVSLSGDGGDELFCGYSSYPTVDKLWRSFRYLPAPLRRLAAAMLRGMPTRGLDKLFGAFSPVLDRSGMPGGAGDKLKKLARIISAADSEGFYERYRTSPGNAMLLPEHSDAALDDAGFDRRPDFLAGLSLRDNMMLTDMRSYLPDDILTKVDRASMAVSLEARVPLLDHRVIEFAWRLPLEYKVHEGRGKRILRDLLARYVPAELVDRPKMGFGVPIEQWLQGPLREWAGDLLSPASVRRAGFLCPETVQRFWQEHSSGERRWHSLLWNTLMYLAWSEHTQKRYSWSAR